MVIWVGLNRHKPNDLGYLRNQENKFSAYNNTPALGIRYPVTIHKTSHPYYKGDYRELP